MNSKKDIPIMPKIRKIIEMPKDNVEINIRPDLKDITNTVVHLLIHRAENHGFTHG